MSSRPRLSWLVLLAASCLVPAQSLAVNGPFDPASYRPLDGPERWERWCAEAGGSKFVHVKELVFGAAGQMRNEPFEWGRTTQGFARRMGSRYEGVVVGSSVHEGMSAALGTDTRYFPCACTGLFHRSGHALEMTFLTYTRGGHKTIDLAQLSGAYGGAMVPMLGWPQHYSPLVQGVQAGHFEIGLLGTLHMVQEFSPELKRFFHLRPGRQSTNP